MAAEATVGLMVRIEVLPFGELVIEQSGAVDDDAAFIGGHGAGTAARPGVWPGRRP